MPAISPPPPAPLPDLLAALHAGDAAGVLAVFTPDGEVQDEGATFRGAADLERWARRVFDYRLAIAVEGVEQDGGGRSVVATTVAGDFPGSPIAFRWHLALTGAKIAALRIEPDTKA